MRYVSIWTVCFLSAAVICPAKKNSPISVSDSKIKKQMIYESRSEYPGKCPCPYDVARNGSSCGGRSAYSRKGGYVPLCYESDITKEMLNRWKEAHQIEDKTGK